MSASSNHNNRRGVTLVELLLVLGVLAAIGGLAWPSVMRIADEHQIKDAAEQVRIMLAKARLTAVDATMLYQFRFEPDGRRFVALPLERDVMLSEPGAAIPVASEELPEGLHFAFEEGQAAPTEQLPPELLALLDVGTGLEVIRWSPAVRFFLDGSADPARLAIVSDAGQIVRIAINPLTGAVSVSGVETVSAL